ncbi:MAG: hypothetical protein JXR86_07230 [Spirochaetales bacterium]|nr:hypothetical protein [Spirochaetales bacterium]
MESPPLYENAHVRIFYKEELNAIYIKWIGFTPSGEFREACDRALIEMEKRKLSKMIADNRESKAVAPEDQRWLSEQWFPRAINSGFRHSAVLVSRSSLNRFATDRIREDVNGKNFEARDFHDLESAGQWLIGFQD